MEKGRDEGRDEGRDKGRDKGRYEGRKEGIRLVAAKLLASGMPVDKVMEMTDLSRAEIQALIAASKHH